MRSLIATAVMAAALKQPARFATLEVPPKDAILGVKEEFLADPAPAADKINLSVGAHAAAWGTRLDARRQSVTAKIGRNRRRGAARRSAAAALTWQALGPVAASVSPE